MKINKKLLKTFPYIVSVLVGLLFYFCGLQLSENIRSLFINISAAFLVIPLLFLFYQTVQNISKRRLNKEIFDYAKMLIDREVLSIVNQLQKIVYPLEERDLSPKGVNKFLFLKTDELKKFLTENEYLGFQIFKTWEISETTLHDILKNPLIVNRLSDDQTISIISIIKSLRSLENIQKNKNLYIDSDKKATSLKVVAGKELSEGNIRFPDRHLLLRDLDNDKFLVTDFGDIPLYYLEKSLNFFKVNKTLLDNYINIISQLKQEIINWLNLTGREFIIDTKMFRYVYAKRNTNNELQDK